MDLVAHTQPLTLGTKSFLGIVLLRIPTHISGSARCWRPRLQPSGSCSDSGAVALVTPFI